MRGPPTIEYPAIAFFGFNCDRWGLGVLCHATHHGFDCVKHRVGVGFVNGSCPQQVLMSQDDFSNPLGHNLARVEIHISLLDLGVFRQAR